ncbi:MAG: ABC transporter permease subunit [Gammaproteobacteria bacterium]|nr:ABC transporter permease subunit [Gammaproteobacteria bacterium]
MDTIKNRLVIWVVIAFGFLASLLLVRNANDVSMFPAFISDPFQFSEWINQGEEWLKKNYRWFTRMIAGGIEEVLYIVEDFLIDSPWLFILMLFVLPALAYGGLPLAILTMVGGLFWGGVGMWEPTMQTLALMGLAVIFSVFFGLILGIASAQNDRFESILKPILDTMQTMPAFVYLLPAVFFFGIGGPPAIMATMIYALPPVVRLTNLGIRQIPSETIEAAHSFGASRLQMLVKVQLPLSMPSVMLGINQTIMMALGLVVLATFIGADGLGSEVWKAIYKLRVGWSLEGGLCIVFMAIIFDRLSLAFGQPKKGGLPANTVRFYLLPQSWDIYPIAKFVEKPIGFIWSTLTVFTKTVTHSIATILGLIVGIINRPSGQAFAAAIRERSFLVASVIIMALISIFDATIGIGEFPESLQFSFREPVDDAVAWLTVNPAFIAFTKGLRAVVYLYLLHPLDVFLTHLPWYITVGVLGVLSWVSVGRNFALACLSLLMFIGACDLWEQAMLTLSSVLVFSIHLFHSWHSHWYCFRPK